MAMLGVVMAVCDLTVGLFPLMVTALVAPYLAAIDWREHRLPDLLVLPAIGLTLVSITVSAAMEDSWARWGIALLCGAGTTVFFWAMYAWAPHQLGFGDVKLMLLLGVMLGWQGPYAVLAGAMVGLLSAVIMGIIVIIFTSATGTSHLALGPHLLLGALVIAAVTY